MNAATKLTSAKARTPGRKLQLVIDNHHDPYRARRRPAAGAVCPVCSLVYVKGRWQKGTVQAGAHDEICPACHRIRDKLPAGFVTIEGPFAYEYREEVLRTARNFALRMTEDHPLQRIMSIDEAGERVVITTTDIHLAKGIGRALHDAFHGDLEYSFNDSRYLLRVHWVC